MKWRRALRAVVCCTLAVLITRFSFAAPYRQSASTSARGLSSERVAPQAPLTLTFALKSSRRGDLDAYVSAALDPASPSYHHWLTPQEIGQRFGATDADIRTVLDYIAAQGFALRQTWPNRLYITATATVAQAEKAFGVKMAAYVRPQTDDSAAPTYYAPDRSPQLPPAIAARVQSVHGLTDAFAPRPGLRKKQAKVAAPNDALTALATGSAIGLPPPAGASPAFAGAAGPPQLSKVYNLDAIHALGVNGQGMRIGIYSPTAFLQSDIDAFAAGYNITGYSVQVVSVNGGITSRANDIEACLDIEVVIGQANNAQVVVYETPNDGNLDTWLKIQTDNLPVISDSWIADENYVFNYKDPSGQFTGRDYMDQFHTIAQMMTAQGMTVFNASGDNGAYNGHSGVLGINFPGGDPNITTVGGTTLNDDSNGFWSSETAWNGSGGGVSVYFARPSWQTGSGTDNRYSNGMRQVPDIAGLADPFGPGYRFYWRGGWSRVGGTSGAAPLWAAAYLLVNQGAGARPGNINPLLYSLGNTLNDATNIFVYHDITSGSNGFYTATPKWDNVTGWGSADFGKLYADLVLQPLLHPFTPPASDPNGVWTAPIMAHTAAAGVTEPATLTDDTIYSFAAAIRNDGPADAIPTVNSLQIDGVDHFFTLGAYAAGYYYVNLQAASAMLAAGRHTLTLVADANNVLKNFSAAANTTTRTIQVAAAPPLVSAVSVTPSRVSGGFAVNGTVTLEGPANAAGAVVQLQSSAPAAASVPATVTVPAGARTATFRIQTYRVSATRTVTISAIRGSATKTAPLTVMAGASSTPVPIGPPIPTLPHGPSMPR